jgi:cytochrome c-type biogenesis protein CcmH/NrfG
MRYSFVADHFQYLASIAMIVPIAVGIQRAVTWRWDWIVLIPLVILTWRETAVYHDSMTLWTDTVVANPHSWMAHTNLGKEYWLRGEMSEAEAQYRLATEQTPPHAEAWWILGQFYRTVNRPFEAETAYRKALEIDPTFPGAIEGLKELKKN